MSIYQVKPAGMTWLFIFAYDEGLKSDVIVCSSE